MSTAFFIFFILFFLRVFPLFKGPQNCRIFPFSVQIDFSGDTDSFRLLMPCTASVTLYIFVSLYLYIFIY